MQWRVVMMALAFLQVAQILPLVTIIQLQLAITDHALSPDAMMLLLATTTHSPVACSKEAALILNMPTIAMATACWMATAMEFAISSTTSVAWIL
jgi:hypothetical protein